MINSAPFGDIIPFLSEHIQKSDQLLFVGLNTDLAIQLSRDGYGASKTGFMTVIDSDIKRIEEAVTLAESIPETASNMMNKKLNFVACDYSTMSEVCKQSMYDAIVDYGGIDSLLGDASYDRALKCIDHLQNTVRLGNILVCLSELEKDKFCALFEKRFGWVNELDGDPGEISAWYRGKTNIQASTSNFKKHGLNMYVYTNTDNC